MTISGAIPILSLPKSWCRRVRSAVLHAISLARLAVTRGRAHAAGSRRALLRGRAEIDRLRQEIALLIKELRIKDARMARVPPPSRLHYPPIERLAILEQRAGGLLQHPWPPAETIASEVRRGVRARKPNHVWHMDLTVVPTQAGLWTSWLPWALPQRWPFCWWVAVVMDQFSRRNMGDAVFEEQPTALEVRQVLSCVIRTIKHEGIRRMLVPLRKSDFEKELRLSVEWCNGHRPHGTLQAATPDEMYF